MSPFEYKHKVEECHLDFLGHVNNAVYLTFFEQARWDVLRALDFSVENILRLQLGPVILRSEVDYLKELRLGHVFIIQTNLEHIERKVMTIRQKLLVEGELMAQGVFLSGFMDLKIRKLVLPPSFWLEKIKALT